MSGREATSHIPAPRSVASTPVGPTTDLHDIVRTTSIAARQASVSVGLRRWKTGCRSTPTGPKRVPVYGQLPGNSRLNIMVHPLEEGHDVWPVTLDRGRRYGRLMLQKQSSINEPSARV